MKRRAAQVTMVLALVAAVAALTHQAVTRTWAIDTLRDEVTAVDAAAARVDLALLDIAASERGYVAPGQGVDFWATRVDAALTDARGALGSLQAVVTDSGAAEQIASAASRVEDLAQIDARIRSFAADGQRQMASDLVFADGYEIVAAARMDAARGASLQRDTATAPLDLSRRIQLASVAGLGLIGAIGLLLTLRRPKLPEPLVTSLDDPAFSDTTETRRTDVARVSDDAIGAALDASLAGLNDAPELDEAQTADSAADVLDTSAVNETPSTDQTEAPLTIQPSNLPTASVNLSAAADVCVDLARLLDMRDLQSVLARAAGVLEADGLIVWVIDPAGQSLAPALMHGYAPDLVARIGSLPMNADNATAAAWREKNAQVVDGKGQRPGAVAVPLLTSDGCMGVLSVEVKEGRERAADVQALARIVAAQLATVVAPPAIDSRRAAEG